MTGVLELLDWQFKSNMMKMLRIIMNKVEHGQCKQRNGNPKKELKSSARDKKHTTTTDRVKNACNRLIRRLGMAKRIYQ